MGSTEAAYRTVDAMVKMIDEPNRSACQRILMAHRKRFQTVQGSTNNHQAWPGGYFDHVQEIMNIAMLLYERLSGVRPLPFTLSEALLIVFLHDIEKPWKYEMGADGQLQHIPSLRTKAAEKEHRERQLEEFGITLTPEQLNGLRYVEGELGDYSGRYRVMGPLAAFCHLADVTSARIWFDHPMEAGDPWIGARRIRDI